MHPNRFLLFDAARAGQNLFQAQEFEPSHRSLYKGRSEETLAAVAPYLFEINGNYPLRDWYMRQGWGKSWGTILTSDGSFEDIYAHFRKFLMVMTDQSKELYFRFYDPRVLKIFLPTCDRSQILEFFGPVEKFIIEFSKEEAIELTHRNGVLQQKNVSAMEVFGELIQLSDRD